APSWAERALNQEFLREATAMLDTPRNPVDAYFVAQHHRLPTRLLDWTVQPLTALFFATLEDNFHSTQADGVLLALEPRYRFGVQVRHDGNPDTVIASSNPISADDKLVRDIVQPLLGSQYDDGDTGITTREV